jgi:hypothetical protein
MDTAAAAQGCHEAHSVSWRGPQREGRGKAQITAANHGAQGPWESFLPPRPARILRCPEPVLRPGPDNARLAWCPARALPSAHRAPCPEPRARPARRQRAALPGAQRGRSPEPRARRGRMRRSEPKSRRRPGRFTLGSHLHPMDGSLMRGCACARQRAQPVRFPRRVCARTPGVGKPLDERTAFA